MTSKLFGTTAIAVGMALWASTALASTTLFIGAEEDGFNGNAITQLGTGPSQLTIANQSYGTFDITFIGGTGTPPLASPDLSVTNFSVTNSANGLSPYSAGTIHVYLTETGLTAPVGPMKMLSTVDWNMASGTLTLSGMTWYSNTNALFGGTQIANLGADTVKAGQANSTGSNFQFDTANQAGTYSETLEITITAPDSGANGLDWANNAGISLFQSVPEPGSLSLLGGGLLAFGAWRRRRAGRKA